MLLRHAAEFGLTARDVGDVLNYLCATAGHKAIQYLWRPVLRDAGDDLVLEVAVAGGAKCIVTHNLRDFARAADRGIRVLSPADFLKMKGVEHEQDQPALARIPAREKRANWPSRKTFPFNQLVATALAEKLSALMTEEYLQARAKRGSRRKFEAVLRKVR